MLRKVITKILPIVSSLFILSSSICPLAVQAVSYGGGSYGSCAYTKDCSTSAPGSVTGNQNQSASGFTILLNDFKEYLSSTGKELTVSVNQVIYFDITVAGQTERHSVTIKAIGPNYIDIVIASNPINDRLYVGDTKQYDVNSDGQKDIQITLNSISTSGQADITFKALSPAPSETKTTPTATTVVSTKKSHTWLWLAGFGGLAAVGLLWFIVLAVKRHKNQTLPPNSQPPTITPTV